MPLGMEHKDWTVDQWKSVIYLMSLSSLSWGTIALGKLSGMKESATKTAISCQPWNLARVWWLFGAASGLGLCSFGNNERLCLPGSIYQVFRRPLSSLVWKLERGGEDRLHIPKRWCYLLCKQTEQVIQTKALNQELWQLAKSKPWFKPNWTFVVGLRAACL